mmetsp:Transcript_45466/g.75280  ORF Transcript_45466/g.75280 Transcript_45466/m.75280 type:complete len:285 (+) Transcript_45466:93-947(+)|eukprot:CAMPEP_0119334330 /NCGR_PEP_ID=MMETSP1333-20130426/87056_1 /TAXON_ID=418940 /ORGANISM="Scyphosphaera apsteinii, Strain RCC1455" /LENGTH=284 /DNA_ID=CAMNT_0007344597 /DNA_START=91 /DNA_END=948 /DNA_ORIENTATION=+
MIYPTLRDKQQLETARASYFRAAMPFHMLLGIVWLVNDLAPITFLRDSVVEPFTSSGYAAAAVSVDILFLVGRPLVHFKLSPDRGQWWGALAMSFITVYATVISSPSFFGVDCILGCYIGAREGLSVMLFMTAFMQATYGLSLIPFLLLVFIPFAAIMLQIFLNNWNETMWGSADLALDIVASVAFLVGGAVGWGVWRIYLHNHKFQERLLREKEALEWSGSLCALDRPGTATPQGVVSAYETIDGSIPGSSACSVATDQELASFNLPMELTSVNMRFANPRAG